MEERVKEEVKNVIILETSDAGKIDKTVWGNSPRRTSTRRTSLSHSNSEGKLLPGYVRSPTSSCHEFCKYGNKHVFEPKKRKPKPRRISGSSDFHGKVQKEESPTLQGRTKKLAWRVKTTQPGLALLEGSKENKVNGPEESQLPDAHAAVEENELFEAPESTELQTYSPSFVSISSPLIPSEESFDERTIERETTAPALQIEELSDTSETSPIEKRVISQDNAMSLTLSEGSSDGSGNLELEPSSSIATPKSLVEGSLDEPLGVGIIPSSAVTDSTGEPERSNTTNPSMQKGKAQISPPAGRSLASKAEPSTKEERSSDEASGMKLKTASNGQKVAAVGEERSPPKNLKVINVMKRGDISLRNSPNLKTISSRDKVIGDKRNENKPPSPVENTRATSNEAGISEQKSPPSVKKAATSVSPGGIKEKTSPTIRTIYSPHESSVSNTDNTTINVIREKRTENKSLSPVEKTVATSNEVEISEQNLPSIKKVAMSASPRGTKQKSSPTIKMFYAPDEPSVSNNDDHLTSNEAEISKQKSPPSVKKVAKSVSPGGTKQKSLPTIKICAPDEPSVSNRDELATSNEAEISEQKSSPPVMKVAMSVSPGGTKQKTSPAIKMIYAPDEPSVSDRDEPTIKDIREKRIENKSPPLMKKTIASSNEAEIPELKSPPAAEKVAMSGSPGGTKQKTSPTIEIIYAPDEPSVSNRDEPATSNEAEISEQKSSPSVKKVAKSVSPGGTKQKSVPTIKMIYARDDPSVSSKLKIPVMKSATELISAMREDPVFKSSRASVSGKPSVPEEKVSLDSVKKRSPKTSSPSKVQAKVGKLEPTSETVKEKTDHKPIKNELMKNSAKYSSLSSSSSSSSLRSSKSRSSHEKEEKGENASALITEANEIVVRDKENTKTSKSVRSPKPEEKKKSNRSPTTQSEALVPSSRKLSFQRGKVVSPKTETSPPCRLKLKQASSAGEDQKGKQRRVVRRRKVSIGSAKEFTFLHAPAVVLRHQAVQEKKDAHGLFNLVIEETANKLVETQKSKVKALVGAFETVISLQESRVTAPTEIQTR